jgi:hypothetical protein
LLSDHRRTPLSLGKGSSAERVDGRGIFGTSKRGSIEE